jgi:hypothetical protein
MYRKISYEMGALFLGILLIVSLSGCIITPGLSKGNSPQASPPWAPADGSLTKHSYRYYPFHRIYFDEQQGVYFYLSDRKWQTAVSLPAPISITADDFITLDMATDKPYTYDNEVLKRYPPGEKKNRDKEKYQEKDVHPDRYLNKDNDKNIYNKEDNNRE